MEATLERLRERRDSGDEGGFTLIELLIVIVILGILAAIVVFAVQNLTQQSSNASCQSDFKTVEVAAEAYKAQTNAYPGLTTNGVNDLLTTTKAATSGQQVGPWLKDTPGGTKYEVVVGTSNLPGPASTANTPLGQATATWGVGTTKAIPTGDGVIWIGTPGSNSTLWTAGNGATLTETGTTWAASASPGPYVDATDASVATGTAQKACGAV